MDFSDLGNRFVLSVEDLSGVWTPIYEHLKRRLPLRQVSFKNKFGVQTTVDELPVQFLSAADPRLQKLRQFAHSPVTWFRNPFVQLVLVSCEDGEEYKRNYRLQLKAMAETEGRAGVAPELLFLYLRPASVDALARGSVKVFDGMRRDLNNKKRERCVRLDPAPGESHAGLLGLEELERSLKEAIRASFEARTAAYDEEVRRLMLSRQQDPAWSFPTLFLFKDSLAVMMEAAGLLDDALREYYELEAVYLESLQAGQLMKQGFGHKAPDADEAALLWQSWHGIRQAVLQGDSVPEFAFRQFLFASQARVLLKQHRLVEVAERGLGFIQVFGALLDQKERDGQLPPRFGAAWAFAAALSLASALSTMQAQRAEQRRLNDRGMSMARWRTHKPSAGTAGNPSSGGSPRSPSPGLGAPHSPASSLLEGPGGSPMKGGPASVAAAASLGGGGSSAATPLANGGLAAAGAAEGGGALGASIDWGLGTLPGDPESGPSRHRQGDSASVLCCLLGHLFSNARSEMMALGEGLGLGPPQPSGGEMLLAQLRGSTASLPAPSPRPGGAFRLSGARTQSVYHATTPTPRAGTLSTTAEAMPLPPAYQPPRPLAETASGTSQESRGMAAVGSGPSGQDSPAALGPMGAHLQAVDLRAQRAQQAAQPGAGAAGGAAAPVVPPLDLSAAGSGGDAGARNGSSSAAAAGGALDSGSFVVRQHTRAASVVSNMSDATGFGGPDSSRSLEAPGAGGPGVTRRLSVRTRTPAGLDGESQASTPKSTISQATSSSPTRAAQWEQQQATGALAATAVAAAEGRGLGEAADVRAIERQVMSPAASLANLESSAPGATTLGGLEEGSLPPFAPSPSYGLPPWLAHWRLRLGLASEELFCDLWRALSEAAARCYAACGRRRHASLLNSDVADVLLWRGDPQSVQSAAELYHFQCRIALREGWYPLAAQTLPKLAACQLASGSSGLAQTAAAMLAVPQQYRLEGGEEGTACKLLLAAAAAVEGDGGSFPVFPPLLAQLDVGGHLALPHLLSCYPPPALSSRFFGITDPSGAPVLSPPAADAAQQAQRGGALQAAVGDVVLLSLHVVSALPVDLPLSSVVLTLGLLQQLTVVYTPWTPTPGLGPQSSPIQATPPALARASASSVPPSLPQTPKGVGAGKATPPPSALRKGGAAGSRLGADGEGSGSQFVSKWQEVEELQCRLLSIHSLGSSPSEPGRGAAGAAVVPVGGAAAGSGGRTVLRPGLNVLTFVASPVKRGVYVPKHVRGLLEQLRLHIDVHPPPSLLCQPSTRGGGGSGGGAVFGGPPPLHLSLQRRQRRSSTSIDGGGGSAFGGLGGESPLASRSLWAAGDAAEQPPEDAVVMLVESARPRVALWPAAAGGLLVAGQRQWLGLVLQPSQDRLAAASLALTWPGAGAGGGPGAAGGGGLLLRGLGSSSFQQHASARQLGAMAAGSGSPFKTASASNLGPHRTTMSLGGASDLAARLGGAAGGRLDAAASSAGPSLAPVGASAVAAPVGQPQPAAADTGAAAAEGTAEGGVELLAAAEGDPNGGPNWLLGDLQEQQQFRLPGWVAERAGCAVWWWVEAGAYTAAPEVVRIARPGAQPASSGLRPHDPQQQQHFLAGGAEAPALPLPAALPPLELAANLEYDSGCHRSHTRVLALPVLQPFGLHVHARELAGGTIMVQAVLQSNLAVPALVTAAALAPQPGLVLLDSMAARLGLLPLRLPPGASATLSFVLQLSESLAGASLAVAGAGGLGGGPSSRGVAFDRTAATAKLQQAAKLQPSVLSVEYELDSCQLCGAPAPALAALRGVGGGSSEGAGGAAAAAGAQAAGAASRGEVAAAQLPASPPLAMLLKLEELAAAAETFEEDGSASSREASPVRRRSTVDSTGSPVRRRSAAAEAGGQLQRLASKGRGQVQRCAFTQLLVLQLAPPEEEGQGALVLLRLLGPFTAVAGQPITLCWRLERSAPSKAAGAGAGEEAAAVGAVAQQQPEAVRLQYEVVAEGDSWRPLGRRSGHVSLGCAPGAVATIEATWVPLLAGTLPVPAVRIQEMRYQELFDVGNENNFIRVLPAGGS